MSTGLYFRHNEEGRGEAGLEGNGGGGGEDAERAIRGKKRLI